MTPYYQDDLVTLYHGDWRDFRRTMDNASTREVASYLWGEPTPYVHWEKHGCLVTDPPYGIAYKSNSRRRDLADSIEGDEDTSQRDELLGWWDNRPALVFGTWRVPRPAATRALLVWDTKGALGMGDLSIPWKPSHQEIYVLGNGFRGPRTTDVLTYAPVQSTAKNGRQHPHEKPVPLMCDLISKTPPGAIVDPFCGSGTTLVAAKKLSRKALGIEIEERYCEIAARRCAQEVLDIGDAA